MRIDQRAGQGACLSKPVRRERVCGGLDLGWIWAGSGVGRGVERVVGVPVRVRCRPADAARRVEARSAQPGRGELVCGEGASLPAARKGAEIEGGGKERPFGADVVKAA